MQRVNRNTTRAGVGNADTGVYIVVVVVVSSSSYMYACMRRGLTLCRRRFQFVPFYAVPLTLLAT